MENQEKTPPEAAAEKAGEGEAIKDATREGLAALKETIDSPKKAPKNIGIYHFVAGNIDKVRNRELIEKAENVMQSLDPETIRKLNLLTPPVFSFEDAGQPQKYPNGYYYVSIDIRAPEDNIKKALENAAKMIIGEPRFLRNTPKENDASNSAQEKGLPFKNIRQAYSEDDTAAQARINWNTTPIERNQGNEWAEPDQNPRFNYSAETPAEITARKEKEKAAKKREEEKYRKAEEQRAKGDLQAREDKEKAAVEAQASLEDTQELNDALAAYHAKKETFEQTYGIKLIAHVEYKEPYKAATIDSKIEHVNGLVKGIDRFEAIFKELDADDQNILKTLELVIDRDDNDKKKPDPKISKPKGGKWHLWINILADDDQIKKDITARIKTLKNNKQYKKDTATGGETAPNTAPDTTYRAARTDTIKMSEGNIATMQRINGRDEIDMFDLSCDLPNMTSKSKRITTSDGKVVALELFTDNKPVGSIYLDKEGQMKIHKIESGFTIQIERKTITIATKREVE